MKKLPFYTGLLLSALFIIWFSHSRVKTTLPRQVLNRYQPDSGNHIVFLGSSLFDAGIKSSIMDSVFSKHQLKVKSYNLALAGLSSELLYYLIIKNWILTQAKPYAIVLEARIFPFSQSKSSFKLTGKGNIIDLTISELLTLEDYKYINGGTPGPLYILPYFLHKYSFLYHNRLNIQHQIQERLPQISSRVSKHNPYGMTEDAYAKMRSNAVVTLERMQSVKPGKGTILRPEGYFLDIYRLTQAQGIRLILLQPPFPPYDDVMMGDNVYEGYKQSLKAICDSLNVLYITYKPDEDIPTPDFSDGIHLDKASAEAFTVLLSKKLLMIF